MSVHMLLHSFEVASPADRAHFHAGGLVVTCSPASAWLDCVLFVDFSARFPAVLLSQLFSEGCLFFAQALSSSFS